jgi:predicted MPP superfamily phosphohydrolase
MGSQAVLFWLAVGAALLALPVAWLLLRRLLRRGSAAGWTLFLLFALSWGVGVWSVVIEPRTLVVRHVAAASDAWRGAPLRIGVIADLHIDSPSVSPDRVKDLVARMNAERPDVVVLLGDYVGGHSPMERASARQREALSRGLANLAGLRAPQGVFAVIGNHDVWWNEADITAMLQRANVRVLVNDGAHVERPGGGYWLAGLADLVSRSTEPSVPEALAGAPAGDPRIVAMHEPDSWDPVPGSVALSLAGHTHCGQVNLPVLGRLVAVSRGARRTPCGLYAEGGRQLYVSGGVGTSILPVRFRAPPEIVVITLRQKAPLRS